MKNCSNSLHRPILALLLCLGISNLHANDCSSAITLSVSPAAAQYSCSSPATGDFGVDGPTGCNQVYTSALAGCSNPSVCSEDLWFQFDPNDANIPTDQYNMTFELSFTGMNTADQVRYLLLYSEGKNSSNGLPCSWGTAVSQTFTKRAQGCWNMSGSASLDVDFVAHGLDGSGTFFLVLETAIGTGGSVDVCLKYDPALAIADSTCSPPSNDRASNATTMTVGTGIDSQAATGGANSWTEAITGTTKCATKQRMPTATFGECSGNPSANTEDHFYTSPVATCITDNSIGDLFFFGTRIDRCVGTNELLDNTVFFTFQRPASDPATDWYLNVGNLDCSVPAYDSITVMIADVFDATNAENTNIPDVGGVLPWCTSFEASGTFPSTPDGYIGPITLNAGQTYAVIVDGVHGAGCDFTMILTRTIISPVLPTRFSYANGENQGAVNRLNWALDHQTELTAFEIERSLDGIHFESLANIDYSAQNQQSEYEFTDQNPPFGKVYYRIKTIDANGSQVLSELIEIIRPESDLNIYSLSPIPAENEILIQFSTPIGNPISLKVVDLAGKTIKENQYQPSLGNNSWLYSVADLAKGVYFFQFNQGKRTLIKKIVKQ